VSEAIAHFVAKWHRREPEMQQAEVFCAQPLRPRFRAWGATLHELREAAFELSDPRVAQVKSQWWAEELAGLSSGRSRHPATAPLAGLGVDFLPLASALLAHAGEDWPRPADAGRAIGQVLPLAGALAASEAAIFDKDAAPDDAGAIAVHLLLQRLPDGLLAEDQARLPMHLLARHGLDAAGVAAGRGEALLRDWAGELLAALPPSARHPVPFRRMRSGFDRARLARLRAGRGFDPPGPLPSLFRAWRHARGA